MAWARVAGVALAAAVLGAPGAQGAVRFGGPAGDVLPASPAGLSVETDLLPTWFRAGSCQSPAQRVIAMAGRPEIRIGGNSQDRLWPNAALPAGQRQVATDPFFHAVRCVGAARLPVLLGLNLLGRDPQATGDLLAAAGGLVPRAQLTLTIGNEPNLYGGRLPRPGGLAGYLNLYGNTLAEVRRRFGSLLPAVAGPDPAAYRWARETADFVRTFHPAQATAHLYGLNGCANRPGTPDAPTVARLLAPAATSDLVDALAPITAAARAARIPAQLDEVNSIACRGTPGISDAPASALWALSLLGEATRAGFRRVAFHTSVGSYDAFAVEPDGTVEFRPLWTAILLADALWPPGTRPLAAPRAGVPAGVDLAGARRPDGGLAVLAVNRDLVHAQRIALRTAARRGVLGRLTARGAHAVALDGRQLVWAGGGPRWRGAQRVTPVRRGAGRTVRFTLAPGTAAWLVLDAHAGARTPATMTAADAGRAG